MAYTYTPNGDLQTKTDTTTGQVTSYAYDGQGNQRHVDLPDGRAIDYLIDSESRRVVKKVNGAVVRKWIYEDQLKPVAEFDGSGTLLTRYLDGVTVKSGAWYRVEADHLYTPRLVVSSTTGAVAQRLDFDDWGQMAGDTGVGFQVFGFAGGIYDPDTGLVRFGARDYDPVVGRWTAKDPTRFRGGDMNLFGYVLGDPINSVDLHGTSGGAMSVPNNPVAIAAGAAIAAAMAIWALCKGIEDIGPDGGDCFEQCTPFMGSLKTYRSLIDGRLCQNDAGGMNAQYAYYCCPDDCQGKPPRRPFD